MSSQSTYRPLPPIARKSVEGSLPLATTLAYAASRPAARDGKGRAS